MENKTVEVPIWKMEQVYEALRLTINKHECFTEKTCFDRIVMAAARIVAKVLDDVKVTESCSDLELPKETQEAFDNLEDEVEEIDRCNMINQ